MALKKGDFDIKGKTISELFQQIEFIYYIPEFQRKVAWREQFKQLLDDISQEYNNNKNAFYYIGSIISFVSEEKEYEKQVIDGQQRITSFVLLFRAYFDFLVELKKSVSDEAAETVIDKIEREEDMAWNFLFKGRMSSGEQDKNILSTSDTGGEKFLKAYVFKKNRRKKVDSSFEDTEEQEYIYNYARKFISDLASDTQKVPKKLEILEEFMSYVLTKVKVADVVAQDFKQAFTMFERMNARGLGLSTTDLFKYLLMAQYSEESIEEFKAKSNVILGKWEEIEKKVKKSTRKDPMLQFLQHHLQAWYWDSKVSEAKVVNNARQIFDRYELDPKDFVDFMSTDADNWMRIVNCNNIEDKPVLDLLFKKQYINKFTQFTPTLLIAMSEGPKEVFENKLVDKETGMKTNDPRFGYLFENKLVDEETGEETDGKEIFDLETYDKLASDAVSIAYLYQVTGAGFNDYEQALPKLVTALRAHDLDLYEKEIMKMKKSQKAGFEVSILDPEHLKENRGQRHFAFHMMEKEVKAGMRQESYEFVPAMYDGEVSEEHIIPQLIEKQGKNATENSIKTLEECKPEGVSGARYIGLVWRLGNLVALWNTTNKVLSDSPPKDKVTGYKGADEYTAQLIFRKSVSGDGNKQDGRTARAYLDELHFAPITLEEGKFTEDHVALREHIILRMFSKKFGMELKQQGFKKSLCSFCSG